MTSIALPDAPFCLADLPALGLDLSEVYRLVGLGLVRRVTTGAFAPARLPDTTAVRAAAAALVVSPHQVVVDRSAAEIHGVDTYGYAEQEIGAPLETCARRGHTRTRRRGFDGRVRDLADADVVTIDGVTVTTPLRTACDLGCGLRRREAYAALCGLARVGGLTAAELVAEIPRFRGRRGVRQLMELAPLVDTRFESQREAWTFLAIHDAGLPAPEPQVWIHVDGVPTYRLDTAYRASRVCVEYNGFDAHELTREQIEYDERRRAWLLAHGWTIIVVRLGDFTSGNIDRWLSELREALAAPYTSRRW